MRIGILTVSDGCAQGVREDTSGLLIEQWCTTRGDTPIVRHVVPDDRVEITRTLLEWADGRALDLILTTGGTGLTDRDVTPEATRAVIDREAPGISEEIRRFGASSTPFACLSRGISGTRGKTLVVNLPGSPRGVSDGVEVLSRVVDHAVALLQGRTEHAAGTGSV
ncbi:MAG: MogA/MoaB family molybdenum cofactor biosynthesis protein [Gemmatimonadetes bacterium]|jgi:molybdopterin adenylyltransferase|nr:MogA/MoaB family molybdenum cofactor biosynthesis protein [Gemmatimonadota bacterium]